MKVGLLGLLEDYDKYRGYGIQRYMHEMYMRMKKNRYGIAIEKVGYKKTMPVIGSGLSFMLGNMLVDFSGYGVIHNMDQKPLVPFRKGRARLVTTVHDFQPFFAPELNDSGPKEKVWQSVINYGMMKSLESDYLIARSTLTMSDAIKLGYDKKKITVISDGVDERYFSKQRRMTGKGFVVGYLGAFRKRKNVAFAIRAFKKVKRPGIKFNIYGKPEFGYRELIALSSGDRRIYFKGFAPEDGIVNVYDSFDAFVFPSLYEGFGIPIIEAQARGLPVIVYKQAKIPEEVRRYCFEAQDESHMAQIIERLDRDGYDDKRRARATSYARSFTWKREADATLEFYKKVTRHA